MEEIKCPMCGFTAHKVFLDGNRCRCICERPSCKYIFDIEM